jgi:peptidoglycan hydrolase-like protein with peptidoglycan-binding domain
MSLKMAADFRFNDNIALNSTLNPTLNPILNPAMTPLIAAAALAGPEVYLWHTGPTVVELQELLVAHGFVMRIDGDFGNRTEAAVIAYQLQHNLSGSGVVGDATWAMLKTTVQAGSRLLRRDRVGMDVYELQGLLRIFNYSAQRDGVFGPKTDQAITAFQHEQKLKPDGIVDRLTWALLRGQPLPPAPPAQTGWFLENRRWF